ncbi:MAG: hypothetical protein ACP6IU_15345 [Candidatus Asgardarchaeia archaeon]
MKVQKKDIMIRAIIVFILGVAMSFAVMDTLEIARANAPKPTGALRYAAAPMVAYFLLAFFMVVTPIIYLGGLIIVSKINDQMQIYGLCSILMIVDFIVLTVATGASIISSIVSIGFSLWGIISLKKKKKKLGLKDFLPFAFAASFFFGSITTTNIVLLVLATLFYPIFCFGLLLFIMYIDGIFEYTF